ncbi:hypothetical protein DL96DRAFT_1626267 [Flagelloscypha sp. PMI_526]|nr:hypothetical protein DL96DRAFT_1626267 [Flagelloscypha sp. PMI_526]
MSLPVGNPVSPESTREDSPSLQADDYLPIAKPPEGMTKLEDIVEWWKVRNAPKPSQQAQATIPNGWNPSCPTPTRISRDWLDFLYWDTGVPPIVGQRLYAFQVVPKGTDGTLPFDIKAAKISLTYPEMGDANAVINDQQKSFTMASGNIIDVRYPVNRDEPDGQYVVRRVRMPEPDNFFQTYNELIEF